MVFLVYYGRVQYMLIMLSLGKTALELHVDNAAGKYKFQVFRVLFGVLFTYNYFALVSGLSMTPNSYLRSYLH